MPVILSTSSGIRSVEGAIDFPFSSAFLSERPRISPSTTHNAPIRSNTSCGRRMRVMQVEEVAADMSPSGCLLNATGLVQPIEASVCISLQRAPEVRKPNMDALLSDPASKQTRLPERPIYRPGDHQKRTSRIVLPLSSNLAGLEPQCHPRAAAGTHDALP